MSIIARMKTPTEYQEMRVLADYLNLRRFNWFHVPNEGKRSEILGRNMRLIGLKAGVPDVHILDQPKVWNGERPKGAVIELKRRVGSYLTREQKAWLIVYERLGWIAFVAKGADAAIEWIEKHYQ